MKYHIDILCAHFALRPHIFDVVVGSVLFGDILSDLGPTCTGVIGIVPSANLDSVSKCSDGENLKQSLFELMHSSALGIAGKGIASSVGTIQAGQIMLEHLGENEAAAALRTDFRRDLRSNVLKSDMGGRYDKAIELVIKSS